MPLAAKHLLVVDDNPVNVEMMLDLLEDHGFAQAHGLSDPREVLRYCQTQCPDLLLLDLRMPHLDGYGVIEQLREHFGQHAPPIIVLTAQVDDATRHRALGMGVRDFLTKPFKHDEVLQRIRNILDVEERFVIRDQQATTLEQMVARRTQELNRQSRTDPITRLANRRGLTQALRDTATDAPRAGLLFIAVDGIEDVIRLHGYGVAERLLRRLGTALGETLDATARLGLWGGSEFLVIVPDASIDALYDTARALLDTVDHDIAVDDLLLSVDARIGISEADERFAPDRQVQMAALALPQKQGVRIQRYTQALEDQQRQRLSVQRALRGAAERGELSLAFQPKIGAHHGRVVGAEALLRWHHPQLGRVSPGLFIPLAEASGDIFAIGSWVIEQALWHIAQWQDALWMTPEFNIAVNVSARQLNRRDFADTLLGQIQRHGVERAHLGLEVTESGLMNDLHNARQQLDRLHAAGIAIAVDDFGTGHSSLAYLKTLPLSTLKIDRAFVMDLEHSAVDRQLAHTITQLAHGVGCNVVAEGIETSAQADYLHRIGCEIMQGYFYSYPLPAGDFAAFCTRHAGAARPA
ncbi:hypothetical protein GCM10022228_21900 [Halomonas cibimaris]|uniref:GGDEF domain-containing response regulator n=1 Tax=Halomonas cibimaris TaxID=657012 RepID=A0ABP7LXM1_9GAMM